ncbi:hypothetical protein F5X96DRAFT_222935 [Biscogniauxia mediterranea]|nr:hypothetical protein F5X96DRAFT_222935 [Biscogniauxia mediterranea]
MSTLVYGRGLRDGRSQRGNTGFFFQVSFFLCKFSLLAVTGFIIFTVNFIELAAFLEYKSLHICIYILFINNLYRVSFLSIIYIVSDPCLV